MENLNFQHLYYFWMAARSGGITGASRELRLAPSTVGDQIHMLEGQIGHKLFARHGRGVALTEMGHVALRYANEIFTLGRELDNTLKDRPSGLPVRLVVGVSDFLPKLFAYQLIEPALRLPGGTQIVCRQDRLDRLLAALAIHDLDLVLSDAPFGPEVRIHAFNHLLVDCGVSFFAAHRLAVASKHRGFPRCLEGLPFLMPGEGTPLRRSLEDWFESQGLRPQVVGEFDDFSLLRVFGESGVGVFAVPDALRPQMRRRPVKPIGHTRKIRSQAYAISTERIVRHPAVVAIVSPDKRTQG